MSAFYRHLTNVTATFVYQFMPTQINIMLLIKFVSL